VLSPTRYMAFSFVSDPPTPEYARPGAMSRTARRVSAEVRLRDARVSDQRKAICGACDRGAAREARAGASSRGCRDRREQPAKAELDPTHELPKLASRPRASRARCTRRPLAHGLHRRREPARRSLHDIGSGRRVLALSDQRRTRVRQVCALSNAMIACSTRAAQAMPRYSSSARTSSNGPSPSWVAARVRAPGGAESGRARRVGVGWTRRARSLTSLSESIGSGSRRPRSANICGSEGGPGRADALVVFMMKHESTAATAASCWSWSSMLCESESAGE